MGQGEMWESSPGTRQRERGQGVLQGVLKVARERRAFQIKEFGLHPSCSWEPPKVSDKGTGAIWSLQFWKCSFGSAREASWRGGYSFLLLDVSRT